jgi:hypothetical protein
MKTTRTLVIYWTSITAVLLLTVLASSADAQSLGGQFGLMLGTLIGFSVWVAFISLPITGVAWLVSCIRKQKGIASRAFHISCAATVAFVAIAQFVGLAQ